MESESKLLAEPDDSTQPGPIASLLEGEDAEESSVKVCELQRSGAEVATKTVKSGRVKYKGLRGWVKCRGDDHLLSQDHILQKRRSVSSKLSKLRMWALMFVMLVGRRPVAADLFCGEGGMSHGLALAGFEVDAVDTVARPRFTQHPRVKFYLADALEFDISKCDVVHVCEPSMSIFFYYEACSRCECGE